MAENRGGYRPTAPQNNPANVSATGGNGRNPKDTRLNYTGMGYGTTGEINRTAQYVPGVAGTAGAAAKQPRVKAPAPGLALPAATPLTAPTQNVEEPITTGADVGAGPGSEILNLPKEPTYNPDVDMVRAYLPAMEFWAMQPGTPQSTKDYVAYLRSIV